MTGMITLLIAAALTWYVCSGVLPWEYLGTALAPLYDASLMSGSTFLIVLLWVGTVFSALASANGCINDAARAWFSMGRDRYLPEYFAAVHPVYRTPFRAILFLIPIAAAVGFLALLTRLALLFSISWVAGLVTPIADFWGFELSWRDIILGGGGLFLLVKATMEIHHSVEGGEQGGAARPHLSFTSAIVQIALLDIVFSLDSVITAVGMANHIAIMVAAVVVAMIVMLIAAAPVGRFVHNHPTVKMLCLSFLLLIGTALIAEALHFHIPKGYIYFAIAFSAGVEALNLMARRKQVRKPDSGERVV
jgi:predicted tellurium resistance membrane protein TerC